MQPSLLLLATWIVAAIGFALFAASQEQHRHRLSAVGSRLDRTWLRALGSLSILASAIIAIARDGLIFGSLIWIMMLSLAAFTVAAQLSRRSA